MSEEIMKNENTEISEEVEETAETAVAEAEEIVEETVEEATGEAAEISEEASHENPQPEEGYSVKPSKSTVIPPEEDEKTDELLQSLERSQHKGIYNAVNAGVMICTMLIMTLILFIAGRGDAFGVGTFPSISISDITDGNAAQKLEAYLVNENPYTDAGEYTDYLLLKMYGINDIKKPVSDDSQGVTTEVTTTEVTTLPEDTITTVTTAPTETTTTSTRPIVTDEEGSIYTGFTGDTTTTTTYVTDENGFVIITDEDGEIIGTFATDEEGEIITTTYFVDEDGLVRITDEEGNLIFYGFYDEEGNLITIPFEIPEETTTSPEDEDVTTTPPPVIIGPGGDDDDPLIIVGDETTIVPVTEEPEEIPEEITDLTDGETTENEE